MVQKGKFAAWALPELIQLKSVDLPTLGSPTIPHLRDISVQFNILQNHQLRHYHTQKHRQRVDSSISYSYSRLIERGVHERQSSGIGM